MTKNLTSGNSGSKNKNIIDQFRKLSELRKRHHMRNFNLIAKKYIRQNPSLITCRLGPINFIRHILPVVWSQDQEENWGNTERVKVTYEIIKTLRPQIVVDPDLIERIFDEETIDV